MCRLKYFLLTSALVFTATACDGDDTDFCGDAVKKCENNKLFVCENNRWSEKAICDDTQICDAASDSGCKDISNECNDGERKCDGKNLLVCSQKTWITKSVCGKDKVCDLGLGCKVVAESCTDGEKKCENNNLLVCAQKTWKNQVVCGNDKVCDAQSVSGCKNIADECNNEEKKCANNNLILCSQKTWTTARVCGNDKVCDTASDSGCKRPDEHCDNGDKKCEGNTLLLCSQNSWTEHNICSDNKVCDAASELGCIDIAEECNNGDKKCDGNNVMVCSHKTWRTEVVCRNGKSCDLSAPGGCKNPPPVPCQDEGLKKCDGKIFRVCKNKVWQNTVCDGKQMCTTDKGCINNAQPPLSAECFQADDCPKDTDTCVNFKCAALQIVDIRGHQGNDIILSPIAPENNARSKQKVVFNGRAKKDINLTVRGTRAKLSIDKNTAPLDVTAHQLLKNNKSATFYSVCDEHAQDAQIKVETEDGKDLQKTFPCLPSKQCLTANDCPDPLSCLDYQCVPFVATGIINSLGQNIDEIRPPANLVLQFNDNLRQASASVTLKVDNGTVSHENSAPAPSVTFNLRQNKREADFTVESCRPGKAVVVEAQTGENYIYREKFRCEGKYSCASDLDCPQSHTYCLVGSCIPIAFRFDSTHKVNTDETLISKEITLKLTHPLRAESKLYVHSDDALVSFVTPDGHGGVKQVPSLSLSPGNDSFTLRIRILPRNDTGKEKIIPVNFLLYGLRFNVSVTVPEHTIS